MDRLEKMIEFLWETYPSRSFKIAFKENDNYWTMIISRESHKDNINPLKPIRLIDNNNDISMGISTPQVALQLLLRRGFTQLYMSQVINSLVEDTIVHFDEINQIIGNTFGEEYIEAAIERSHKRAKKINEALADLLSGETPATREAIEKINNMIHDREEKHKVKLSVVKGDEDAN